MAQVQIIIAADAKQAIAELKKVGIEAERTGQSAKKGGEGFKDLGSTLDSTAQKLKDLLTPANLLGGALGIGLVAGLRKAVSAATDYGDEMTRLQIVTGSSVRDLAILQDAAGKVGVSFQSLQRGLFFMANEAQTAGASFIRLGISVRDQEGVFKDGATLLFDTVDALSKVEDASQRASLARQIFSRGAVELLPLLSKTSAELRAMGVDGARMAELLGAAGVGPLKLLGIALSEVGQAIQENLIIFVRDITPALKALADSLAAVIRLYQFLPEQIRRAIPVIVVLTTVVLALVASFKALALALTLVGVSGGVAGLGQMLNVFANLGTAIGLTTLQVGALGMALRAIPPILAIALVLNVGDVEAKLTNFLDGIRHRVITPWIAWLADKIRGAFGAGSVADALKKGLSDAEDALMKGGTGKKGSPLGPEELAKQLAMTKLLIQAEIELGQVTGNSTAAQVNAVKKRVELQIKELTLAKEQGQFLLEDAQRLDALKKLLRVIAGKAIDRLRAEELVKELEHNAALEKLMIDRFQTGEDAAINTARVDRNLAEQRLKVYQDANVATLEDTKKTALAIEASQTTLDNALDKLSHERVKVRQEVVQAEADLLLKGHERIRDLAVEVNQDDIRLTKEALEDKLISQQEYTERLIESDDNILTAKLTFLKADETHTKESAARQIAIIKDAITMRQVDANVGAIQIEKIEADLNLKLQELGIQRKAAYKENRETITAIEREAAKLHEDILIEAENRTSAQAIKDLEQQRARFEGNAAAMEVINAKHFRALKRDYDQDVQDFIDAELLKTGILKDETAKRLAQEAGVITQVKQFRQQAIDNAGTVLLQTARQAGDLGQAFAVGFAHAATAADDALDLMAKSGADAFRSLSSGLSDFVFDTITGAKSIGDIFVDLGKRILRTMLDVFAQIAVKQVAMALGFNVLAQAGIAGAAGGGGAVAGGTAGGGGAIGGLLQQFPLLGQLLQVGASGGIGFGLGSMIFGSGAGGTGASIGSMVGTIAGMIVPGLTFAIGSFISALIPSLAAGLAALGVAAPIALIGNFILPGIGLIIGGLVGFLIDLFTGPPTARLYVQLQSTFLTKSQEFLKGMVGSFGAHVSADMPRAQAIGLENQILDAMNKILIQLVGSLSKAQIHLPRSLTETMNTRLMDLATRSPFLAQGEREFNLEKPEELKAAIEALPNQLIRLFSEAVFGGLDISTLKRDGEELADTFVRVLNSMVGFSEILGLFGGKVDALVASMGTGDAALAAFVQRSLAFFQQFAKEDEKFEDTLKRVVQAFAGMQGVLVSFDQRLAELSGDSTRNLAIFQQSLVTADVQLQKLSDQLLIAFETGTQPDELLTMLQQLTEATTKRYQSEIEFVQKLAQALEALKVSGGQFLLSLQTTIGTLALQTGQGFGQFGVIGQVAPGWRSGLSTQIQLAFVSGLTEALRQAALAGIESGGDLGGVFAGRQQLIGFGQGLFGALQGEKDPSKALAGLQQLAAGVIQLLAGEIEATEAFYSKAIAGEQALAQTRLNALDLERQALRDNETAIQDEIAAIQEAADARLAPLREEQTILQDQLQTLQAQAQAAQAWASVIESVNAQLLQMRTSLDNPQNALERLRYVQDLVGSARERFAANPTPETAREFQDLLQQELQLAQEAFQRPSSAYQAIFDQVAAELEGIRAVAEANAGDLESLTAEIAEHQARLVEIQTEISAIERETAAAVAPLNRTLTELQRSNQERLRAIETEERGIRETLATRIAALQSEQTGVIAGFRAEASGWLQSIRDEALKRIQEAITEGDTALQTLLGDKTLDQFIAEKNQEQSDRLTEIRDALLTYLGRLGVEVPVSPQRITEASAGLKMLAELAQGAGLPQIPQLLMQAALSAGQGNLAGVTSGLQQTLGTAQGIPAFQTPFGLQALHDFGSIIELIQANQFQGAINSLASFITLLTQAGFTARAPVPGFQHGTAFVPQTGLALLHRGERVIPAEENRRGSGDGVTVNVKFEYRGSARKDEFDRFMETVIENAKTKELASVIRDAVRRGKK